VFFFFFHLPSFYFLVHLPSGCFSMSFASLPGFQSLFRLLCPASNLPVSAGLHERAFIGLIQGSWAPLSVFGHCLSLILTKTLWSLKALSDVSPPPPTCEQPWRNPYFFNYSRLWRTTKESATPLNNPIILFAAQFLFFMAPKSPPQPKGRQSNQNSASPGTAPWNLLKCKRVNLDCIFPFFVSERASTVTKPPTETPGAC